MSITGLIRTKRWLAHAVAVLVLALSSAPAVARMQCLESGHERYAVGDRFDCCMDEHPEGTTVFRATCCEVDVADPHKADYVPQVSIALYTIALERSPVALWLDPAIGAVPPLGPEDVCAPPPLGLRLSHLGSFLL